MSSSPSCTSEHPGCTGKAQVRVTLICPRCHYATTLADGFCGHCATTLIEVLTDSFDFGCPCGHPGQFTVEEL